MKQRIEYLEVLLESENQRSRREWMSPEQVAENILHPDFHGASVLFNVRSLTGIRAYLILSKGELSGLLQSGANGHSIPDLTQLVIYPLNFKGYASPNSNSASVAPPQAFPTASKPRIPAGVPTSSDGETMTTAQRRYLFRLLAEKMQLKGKQAEDYLKSVFDVQAVQEIDKASASQLIDQLLNGGD